MKQIIFSIETVHAFQIEKTSQMTGLFYLVPTVVCDNRPLRRGFRSAQRERETLMVSLSHYLFLPYVQRLRNRKCSQIPKNRSPFGERFLFFGVVDNENPRFDN